MCLRSKKKNNHFSPPVKAFQERQLLLSEALFAKKRSPKNSLLGILMRSLLIAIQEVNKKVRTSSSLILKREFRRQASKGSAVTDQEKSLAVNGKKVSCETAFTKIALFGEIMASKARVNKRKSA